ncbi:helix-turn-helix transcriptional regulator [uncultured Tolumonas sp.]|uniref:AraC family transcriptional regulator n=1 Tax=uncultured Tolumonas sp. TaxID=263765 RepID=UPI00292D9909|nr:helix-turn-helix transcriptional regulator [uncultured Tolumonas sp.]
MKPPRHPSHQRGPLRVFARDYPDQHRIDRHQHPYAQFLYASSGVMRLTTARGRWLVPPLRGVWIPPRTPHAVAMEGPVAMRSLYVPAARCAGFPEACQVLKVRPFLRALIVEAALGDRPPDTAARGGLLGSLILLELERAAAEPLCVPLPRDPRLRRVCRSLLADPGGDWSLDRWAEEAGTSARTLARLFQAEFGMGFRAWRDQVRLSEAIARLGCGASVEAVARDLGYRGASAFIAMFHRNLGSSPRAYLDAE